MFNYTDSHKEAFKLQLKIGFNCFFKTEKEDDKKKAIRVSNKEYMKILKEEKDSNLQLIPTDSPGVCFFKR